MTDSRRNRVRVFVSATLAAATLDLCGCVALYRSYPITVTVTDAESDAPIAGARVELSYLYVHCLNPPEPASGSTGTDGRVEIQATTFESKSWQVSADGYSPLESAFGFDPGGFPLGTPPEFKLYRAPLPEVVIVVPDGYIGPLLVDRVPVASWVQERPGTRRFTYSSSDRGYVRIDASPLLLRTRDFSVTRRDGTPIQPPRSVYDEGSALRHVTSVGRRLIYMVGTPAQERSLLDLVVPIVGDNNTRSLDHAAVERLFAERGGTPEPASPGTGGR